MPQTNNDEQFCKQKQASKETCKQAIKQTSKHTSKQSTMKCLHRNNTSKCVVIVWKKTKILQDHLKFVWPLFLHSLFSLHRLPPQAPNNAPEFGHATHMQRHKVAHETAHVAPRGRVHEFGLCQRTGYWPTVHLWVVVFGFPSGIIR